jgi:hypothetical protein
MHFSHCDEGASEKGMSIAEHCSADRRVGRQTSEPGLLQRLGAVTGKRQPVTGSVYARQSLAIDLASSFPAHRLIDIAA